MNSQMAICLLILLYIISLIVLILDLILIFRTFYAESEDKYFDIKGYNILLLAIVFIIPGINAICIEYDLVNRLYDLNWEFENHPGRVYNKNKFVNNILNFLLNSL
jgi:hypothetical protein